MKKNIIKYKVKKILYTCNEIKFNIYVHIQNARIFPTLFVHLEVNTKQEHENRKSKLLKVPLLDC